MDHYLIAMNISGALLMGFMLSLFLAGTLVDSGPGTRDEQIGMRIISVGALMLPPALTFAGLAIAMVPGAVWAGGSMMVVTAPAYLMYPKIIRAMKRPLPSRQPVSGRIVTNDGRTVDASQVPLEPTGMLH